jgi:peptide deformylase
MTLLTILEYPNPRLRKKAKPVESFNDELSSFIQDMYKTMYHAKGIGLAATQVDVHKRILVLDVSENYDSPMVMINPKIIEKQGVIVYEEGCLSVPGIFEKVDRFEKIKVTYYTDDGTLNEIEAEGLLSICIQHEIDHLEGKLFVDYLSSVKRSRLKKAIEKRSTSELLDPVESAHKRVI